MKSKLTRPCTGIRSTQPEYIGMVTSHIPTKDIPHPDIEPQRMVSEDTNVILQDPIDTVNNIFYFSALADKHKKILYTDVTGTLLEIPLCGHQYSFVAHTYATIYIFVEQITNIIGVTIVDAFDGIYSLS